MENIFCIECGFELPATAKFCKKCGIQMESVEASTEVVAEITKAETIESKSKPVTQAPIKATPSKAMSIGTTILEWIIIFVVAFMVGGIAGFLFGERSGSVIGFIAFLAARVVIRQILKSILPLRYQYETAKEDEAKTEVKDKSNGIENFKVESKNKSNRMEGYSKFHLSNVQVVFIGLIIGIILTVLIIWGIRSTDSKPVLFDVVYVSELADPNDSLYLSDLNKSLYLYRLIHTRTGQGDSVPEKLPQNIYMEKNWKIVSRITSPIRNNNPNQKLYVSVYDVPDSAVRNRYDQCVFTHYPSVGPIAIQQCDNMKNSYDYYFKVNDALDLIPGLEWEVKIYVKE